MTPEQDGRCHGCGTVIGQPVLPQGGGRRRKWCSERCRKAQYGGRCIDCGAPTYGGDGAANAPTRCRRCGPLHEGAAKHAVAVARQERYVAMVRAGMLPREIAAAEGIHPNTVSVALSRARRNGIDVPKVPTGWQAHRAVKLTPTSKVAA